MQNNDGMLKIKRKIWVLDDATELKLKIVVEAHCGIGRPQGKGAKRIIVRGEMHGMNLKKAADELG